MKKHVLVTLADKNFINQAKQLFSSAYWNAGWQGDYLLLAHEDIPEEELKWFKEKGILIYKTKPITNNSYKGKCPPIVFEKFYLFRKEFKQWEKILFLDADIIINYSLDTLTSLRGFSATADLFSEKLEREFKKQSISLKEKYNLNSPVFNSGFFVLETKNIKDNTFDELIKLKDEYASLIRYGEQAILNLYWYKKWNKLPIVYNFPINLTPFYSKQLLYSKKAVIIHFACKHKPWHEKNAFFQQWKKNLSLSEKTNFAQTPFQKKVIFLSFVVLKNSLYLNLIYKTWQIRKIKNKIFTALKEKFLYSLYLIGRIIKKISPRLYYFLGGKN